MRVVPGPHLAVAPERQGAGLGCPKVSVQVRSGNEAVLAFSHRLGYTVEATSGMGRRLVPDV